MGGKALLFVILGFNLILMVAGLNYNRSSTRAVENDVDFFYYNELNNLALTGANIALNELAINNAWESGYDDLEFGNGKIDIDVINISGVEKKLVVTAKINNKEKKIYLNTRPGSFANYANYTSKWPGNGYLGTGDTIFGRFHTQDQLNVKGKPVFLGPASAKKGLKKLDNNTYPEFHPNFSIDDQPKPPIPSELFTKATEAGHVFASGNQNVDVKIKFNQNGTITYQQKVNNGSWSTEATEPLTTFAPNGILYLPKGDVYLQGTVSGQVTVVAEHSAGNGHGNVYIEDNVLLKNDPRTNSSSTDALSIICSNDIKIVNNAANRSNVEIFAAIFSEKGGLTIHDHNMPASGYLTVYGSLVEEESKITGYANASGTITKGYNQKIYYDNRFLSNPPKYFPLTGKLELASWLEIPIKD